MRTVKTILALAILANLVSCGVEGDSTGLLNNGNAQGSDVVEAITGEMDDSGRLIIANDRYRSWDGRRLQGSSSRRVLAYD